MSNLMKFSFLVQKSCPYNCRGLQFYGHLINFKKAVHTPAEVCSCMVNLFSTPKTVHTPAEVCSFVLKLENVATTPKTVHPPANVCSLRDCPYTCSPLQFEPHFFCGSWSTGVWISACFWSFPTVFYILFGMYINCVDMYNLSFLDMNGTSKGFFPLC